ncbi:Na(+)-translocating NADH-quinone reductase subunit C [Desulfotalea psychrophila]|uniref:Na(+)-translocating NADH-quinone reductase subunit C n=1 Tax=Desulfotalea psychrophila (strain LSv54 / DSM 12343) TaxID=177439 RepID=Q6AM92_DESPS|nr:Na(+)-translocating NADH-quinone reductase subunit C [Desulfotalea psychrophila]CAG36533.1 probable Na+-translocating NADH:quinone oxidoreductase, subunit C [Desulfotalea psychrophila LSv54]
MFDIRVAKPFYSALILAFVCSALVAAAAVGLRPLQEENKKNDQQKNVLYAAGIYDKTKSVDQMFTAVTPRLVDLKTGAYIASDVMTPEEYNQDEARSNERTSRLLPSDEDIARLNRQENISLVYLVKKEGVLSQIILPVRGKGLWSTMFAYVAISSDLNTITGVSFYQHGETPGLGGEITNPRWLAKWQGKKIYDQEGATVFRIAKGRAQGKNIAYRVDGLSGATFTARGVSDLMLFWFGNDGFKPYLSRLEREKYNG